MDGESRKQLVAAYRLIKTGQLHAAAPLVQAILNAHPQNQDAWWLAVYIAPTASQKIRLLEHLLSLAPDHQAAQLLLQRLQAPPAPPITSPQRIVTKKISSPRRKIKWPYVLLSVFGLLAALSVPLLLIDNLSGGQILGGIQKQIFGEKAALGWVDGQQGGRGDADSQDAIPITHQNAVRFGDIKIEVLSAGEAHRYRFSAQRGDELMIAAMFTSNGNTELNTLELWDSNGQLITREFSAEGFELGNLFGARVLHYNVARDGQFSVVLVGRSGGGLGNYSLMVDTTTHILENPPNFP